MYYSYDQCETKERREPESCRGCVQTDMCREVWASENKGPLSPAGLVLASMTAFFVPVLTAIGGGVVAHALWSEAEHAGGIQAGGVVVGLAVGVGLAWLLMPVVKRYYSSEGTS